MPKEASDTEELVQAILAAPDLDDDDKSAVLHVLRSGVLDFEVKSSHSSRKSRPLLRMRFGRRAAQLQAPEITLIATDNPLVHEIRLHLGARGEMSTIIIVNRGHYPYLPLDSDEASRVEAKRARFLGVWQISPHELAILDAAAESRRRADEDAGVAWDAAWVTLGTLDGITDLLERYLRPDRIPVVVRRPADKLGGRSMLDLVRDGQLDELLDYTREMFDLSRADAL